MNRNFIFHGLISWSILGASCLWADGTESVTNSGNTYVAEKSPSWWRTLAVPKVTDGAETNGSNVNLGTLATGDQFQASALELRVQKDSKFVTELSNKVAAEKFPNWGLMLKTGLFKPSTSDWDSHYEDHSVFQYGVGASYRIWNGIHLKTEVEQWNVKGKGTLNTGGLGSELKYQVRPYRLGLSYEYARSSLSMVRPFVGMGYNYSQYQQKISDGSTIKGHGTGYYYEAGLLFNFYNWSSGGQFSPNSKNVFWLLGVQKNSVQVSGAEIGGWSYDLGLQFRF